MQYLRRWVLSMANSMANGNDRQIQKVCTMTAGNILGVEIAP